VFGQLLKGLGRLFRKRRYIVAERYVVHKLTDIPYFRRAGGQNTRDNSPATQPPSFLQRQSHFCGGRKVVLDSVYEAATDSLFEITGA
jgi:hypothetical protein